MGGGGEGGGDAWGVVRCDALSGGNDASDSIYNVLLGWVAQRTCTRIGYHAFLLVWLLLPLVESQRSIFLLHT